MGLFKLSSPPPGLALGLQTLRPFLVKMESDALGKCANCGQNSTARCTGCRDAPEHQPGDSVDVFYCGRDCQAGHWPKHKAHCQNMRKRRKLLRAANLLKLALLTYREVAFDVDLNKIEFQDGLLRLHQNQTARPKRRLFPSHITTSTEHKEAALANNQCTTAMALLGRLTRKLLAGKTAHKVVTSTNAKLTF